VGGGSENGHSSQYCCSWCWSSAGEYRPLGYRCCPRGPVHHEGLVGPSKARSMTSPYHHNYGAKPLGSVAFLPLVVLFYLRKIPCPTYRSTLLREGSKNKTRLICTRFRASYILLKASKFRNRYVDLQNTYGHRFGGDSESTTVT
jgi:hypothetical protein